MNDKITFNKFLARLKTPFIKQGSHPKDRETRRKKRKGNERNILKDSKQTLQSELHSLNSKVITSLPKILCSHNDVTQKSLNDALMQYVRYSFILSDCGRDCGTRMNSIL